MPEAIMRNLHSGGDAEYLKDLEKEILDAVGDLSGLHFFGQEILVAPYFQPSIRKSGIIMSAAKQSVDDKWQSKSFMILKYGDRAEAAAKKHDRELPKIGKWYFGAPQTHKHISIKGEGGKNREPINNQPYREFDGWPCRTVLIGDIDGHCERPWEIM